MCPDSLSEDSGCLFYERPVQPCFDYEFTCAGGDSMCFEIYFILIQSCFLEAPRCIPAYKKCNKVPDCFGGEDENDCPLCGVGEWYETSLISLVSMLKIRYYY